MPTQTEVVHNETFAPILYVLTYDGLDEAISLNNAVPQGLSSAIFTVDVREAERFMGVIPGSMGTRSYIVRGKGNPAALCSAPHGAGRRFSRTEARRRFTAADLAERMEGIEYRHGEQWVDEIPDAYKSIDVVIEDSKELVEVVTSLRQVVNVKGT